MKDQGKQPTEADRELTPLDSARLAGPRVPTRVRIAPWGEVESTSGGFIVDDEAARLVVEAFDKHGTDLPIDYEHQTLGGPYASPTGQAPAAGWIKRLEVEPGRGIIAVVEWTQPALEQLAAKQYRYLSPVALVRKSDRKLLGLHSVALTNKPAIVGMDPIVNRAPAGGQATPRAPAPGDGEGAATGVLHALRERLALPAECDVDHVMLAASRRFDQFDRDRALREAEDRVRQALRCGRVTEAQHDFAIRLALRDPGLFDEWLRTAPVVIPMGRTTEPDITAAGPSLHSIEARARAEYRAHPELAALTSEEAYVADVRRQHGL